jgi:alpha-L-fucosidase
MYDTKLSEYKVTNTPFKRDPIAELAAACARRGDVKLGFYSSLLDWHHPAYRFRPESGLAWDDYIAFLHGQVAELCSNFGDIVCIWFDGDWPHHKIDESNAYFVPGGSFEYGRLYGLIHTLQPNAVIHNNRHEKPLPGEDVQGFEQDLPGENTAGFNETRIFDLPIEVCMTINDHWGYSADDHNHKSTRTLIHKLVRSAAFGGNYLLNVGPTPQGEILPVHAQRLREIGQWLAANGKSIYGTRVGKLAPSTEVVSTSKGDTHYIHLLEYRSDCVKIELPANTQYRASLVRDGTAVKIEIKEGMLMLMVPAEQRDPIDSVVALTMATKSE